MATPTPKLASKLFIFLSYRSVEARFADVLKRNLTNDFIGMVDVFLASDTTSIPAGTKWHSRVLQGLSQSDLHIVVCSRFSVRCPSINYEAGAAALRGTPIVPLCHGGLVPHQLPVPLSESEGGVFTDANALQRLYTTVADLLGCGLPHVDLQGTLKSSSTCSSSSVTCSQTTNSLSRRALVPTANRKSSVARMWSV